MSFVGPRPLIPEEIEINKETSLRTLVRPGLTGLAQVLVHKNTPLLEKFKYDLWYIENQNLILDLKIIICSFMVSFKGGWESGRKNLTFYFHIFNIL
jgi:lipopolysaccharide/colanic/teichoic acid biosynthesis glycosyltransferase